MNPYDQLCIQQKRQVLIGSLEAILNWDESTVMPPSAAAYRGEQLAWLASQKHQASTSSFYQELVEKAVEETLKLPDKDPRKINAIKAQRDLREELKIPGELVEEMAKARSEALAAWQIAKSQANFSLFAPSLENLIKLVQNKAQCLLPNHPVAKNPYDTLLSRYDYGVTTEFLDSTFSNLKKKLKTLVGQAKPGGELPPGPYHPQKQERLCLDLAWELGFQKEKCVKARSAHPFSTTLGPSDFRVTTRYLDDNPLSSFLALAHEMGHSHYEQGLPKEHYGTAIGSAASMGVHESQSLFWENRVVGSKSFLARWYPRFVDAFPEVLSGYYVENFLKVAHGVQPSFIRVDADELTYCLHIIVRYEIEKALMNGDLTVREIPEIWNQKYHENLGITPPDDKKGCLQDIHWAFGEIGYFPSYALGHLISAQLSLKLEKELGNLETLSSNPENITKILIWLQQNVHSYGALYEPLDLVQIITGVPLSDEPFISYLQKKYI